MTGETLTKEQESILRFGLKHNLATRPKETEIIAIAESIWKQLNQLISLNGRKSKTLLGILLPTYLTSMTNNLKLTPNVSKYLKNYD